MCTAEQLIDVGLIDSLIDWAATRLFNTIERTYTKDVIHKFQQVVMNSRCNRLISVYISGSRFEWLSCRKFQWFRLSSKIMVRREHQYLFERPLPFPAVAAIEFNDVWSDNTDWYRGISVWFRFTLRISWQSGVIESPWMCRHRQLIASSHQCHQE